MDPGDGTGVVVYMIRSAVGGVGVASSQLVDRVFGGVIVNDEGAVGMAERTEGLASAMDEADASTIAGETEHEARRTDDGELVLETKMETSRSLSRCISSFQ
jgi:hypothetical protein